MFSPLPGCISLLTLESPATVQRNLAEAPVLPEDPSVKPVAQQPDVLEKAHAAPNGEVSQTVSIEDVKKAEAEALKAVRKPVNATAVGWKQIGEWEEKDALTLDDELMDLTTPTLLDSFIPEAAYGDWYHTVGLFIVAGLLSFIFGWFNFSLAPVFFITLFAGVYYRTSIKKYRSVLRDQIQMEFTAQKIENDYETMDWLNTFLDKYWTYLEPSISQIVCEQVNPILASQESIPAFVKAIWIDELTLGTKPPRIDLVKTLDIPKNDVAVMDWGFSFTPNDIVDNSAKQLKNHVNQRVVVKANVFGVTLPVVVRNVAFKSWVRFDFISTIFGESIFNWEILAIPGLYPFINEMIKKFAGPMLFEPFSFQLNVPQLLSGSNTSIGIIAVHLREAKNLRAADRVIGNTVDPYVTFRFHGQKKVFAKSKTILDTSHPKWDETVYVLVGSFTEPMVLTFFDYNDDRKDKQLGKLHISMNEVSAKPVAKNQVGQILRSSKPCGELLYDYEFFPTLEPQRLDDGSVEPAPELNTGLTKLELTEIRNVKTAEKALSSYTELYFNDELVGTTKVFKNNDNPSFSIPLETIVTDRRKAKVKVIVKDPKGKIIAASVQSLNNLIDRTEIDKPWVPFSKGEGEFKFSAVWKSVEIPNVPGSGGYTDPIGVVRVLFNKAEDLLNLEKFGKVDPYARVLVNGTQKGRTDMIPDELNPVWNKAVWITVSSPNQRLTVEVMDYEKNGDDRSLGSFNLTTSEIINTDDDGKYVEYIDTELRTGKLVTKKKGPRGIVTYGLSFYPVTPVKSVEDIKEELMAKQAREAKYQREREAGKTKEEIEKEKKEEEKEKDEELDDIADTSKAEMPLTELITHPVGVFVYSIIAGEFASVNSYLQLYFDAAPQAAYTSQEIKTKYITTPSTGDVIVKELEWSTCTFRLVKKKRSNRSAEAIAETTIPTLSLLKNSYDEPNVLTMQGSGTHKIKIQTRWIPLQTQTLPPSDLITNSGNLDLDILACENLPAADSNGKSDPFVKCYLNSEEDNFFKTKTVKKTLNPVWDDAKTAVEIDNRVNTKIRFKVRDWDFGAGQDDVLGDGVLDLAEIDPINPTKITIPLVGEKGEKAGTLIVKASFRPGYVIRVNASQTNVADVGLKSIGTGIGAGLKGGKAIVGGGVGIVGKVKKGIFGGKKDESDDEEAS
ncbi:Tricalbin-1 [Cyberlindnera jadinii]|uniref:Tricalbin-1 n=1 Tax=Cyberlindnera jadinii (strain ATCC 18201 / CBS 1600 / BCRC 20928 / JCM 3617 / NBRC 0987 / NRRL Y-1542) TaxID=983966 RepID=A0A0H5C7W2_CYBJN|nr:Tricalbin-1 [Cyberlindnera jadinii]